MSSIASPQTEAKAPHTVKSFLAGMLALVAIFAFAGFVTVVAPISYVSLSYDGETVSASVTRLIYMLVPYRTERLAEITQVDISTRDSYHERSQTTGRSRTVEAESHLFLVGPEGELDVMVSPVNLQGAAADVAAFISSPSREGMGFVAVANWKFSVLFGGLISTLPWLLVGCMFYELGRLIWRGLRRLG